MDTDRQRITEKWVVTAGPYGGVTSAYFSGPGAEEAARNRAEETGGTVWYITEIWVRS